MSRIIVLIQRRLPTAASSSGPAVPLAMAKRNLSSAHRCDLSSSARSIGGKASPALVATIAFSAARNVVSNLALRSRCCFLRSQSSFLAVASANAASFSVFTPCVASGGAMSVIIICHDYCNRARRRRRTERCPVPIPARAEGSERSCRQRSLPARRGRSLLLTLSVSGRYSSPY